MRDRLQGFDFFYLASTLCCLIFVGFVFYYTITGFEGRMKLATVMVPLVIIIYTLFRGERFYEKGGRTTNFIVSLLFGGLSLLMLVYLWVEYYDIIWWRPGDYNIADFAIGAIGIVFVLEIIRREYGKALPVIIAVSAVYCLFGQYIPGFFGHGGISFSRLISATSLELTQGIFGLLPQVGVTWIAIFLILAGLAKGFGNLDSLINVCKIIPRKAKYGVPQAAVVSSLVVGGFSGSAAANVAATGSFTIPLMKKYGMPPTLAGAIEAVSSSGGQVMPPVMGAAVFVMCELLGVRYLSLIVKGLGPALIFYFCTALAVYLIARRYLKPAASYVGDEFRVARADVINIIPLVVAVAALIFMLAYYMMGIMYSGMLAIASLLLTEFILRGVRAIRGDPSGLKAFPKNFLAGIRTGTESSVGIVLLLSAMGIIVSLLTVTGFTLKIVILLTTLAGGSLAVLLILVMLVCLTFGMGVPTVAAYLMVAVLAAPALLEFGIAPINTHFFVFYLAILSALTPPVAACSVIGCKIAGAPFWQTCGQAIRLALPLFVLPFMFIIRPEFLSGTIAAIPAWFIIAIGFIGIIFGIYGLSTGLRGYVKRTILVALGFVVLFYTPLNLLSWLCLGLLVILSGLEFRRLLAK